MPAADHGARQASTPDSAVIPLIFSHHGEPSTFADRDANAARRSSGSSTATSPGSAPSLSTRSLCGCALATDSSNDGSRLDADW